MKETKNARFRRVAEARVNKIIRMLRLLGNCSGTNTYAYYGPYRPERETEYGKGD